VDSDGDGIGDNSDATPNITEELVVTASGGGGGGSVDPLLLLLLAWLIYRRYRIKGRGKICRALVQLPAIQRRA
jgi:hypothetical protein